MSANVPAVTEDRGAVPDDEALWAELKDLAKQYHEPDWHEAARDREWYATEAGKGAFDHLYGKSLVVFERRVVGVGDNYLVLLVQAARQYQQHPGRFYAVYHGDPFESV